MELSPHINLIQGSNASGKSSLIEAICLLSRGKSYRSPRINDLIRDGAEGVQVNGQIHNSVTQTDYPVGIYKTSKQTSIRVNYADCKQQAELSSHLPLTVIHPDTIELLTGSPSQRRAMLDWVAFYQTGDFHQDWKIYQRVLSQRNACLRDQEQRYALSYWSDQLSDLQPRIHQYRSQALKAIQEALADVKQVTPYADQLELKLFSGFPANIDIHNTHAVKAFYQEKQVQEIKQGFSLHGVHRGDMQVLINSKPAARWASRGELKLLSIALLLAQSQALSSGNNLRKRGIIAIDDLASELDVDNQNRLYQVLGSASQQIIITGTQFSAMDSLSASSRLFHVKQGHFQCIQDISR